MRTGLDIVLPFAEISIDDVKIVGGKNASLGEMYRQLSSKGILVPDGFAVTAYAYWDFLESNNIKEPLEKLLEKLDRSAYTNLNEISEAARKLVLDASFPDETYDAIVAAYFDLCERAEANEVAVRSSATAEDLPSASFAGQHESFLNISGEESLMGAIQWCYASLFNARAIKYREDNGFDHMSVALSVGVQKMVRSDLACSGIAFTIEPESGFKDIIHVAGTWGLGENIVQGAVNPDEYLVFKPTLQQGKNALISKHLGSKSKTMIYADHADHQFDKYTANLDTPQERRNQWVLSDEEVTQIARWALMIEAHYNVAMDIEWAKDGLNGDIYIVQARPETVSHKKNPYTLTEYKITNKGKILSSGSSVGSKIISGVARIIQSPAEAAKLQQGEILVTEITDPDWDVVMKKASAIVTDKGGRTSHASIVARELGLVAVVGTGNATSGIQDGQLITVSCAEGETGFVYDGAASWEESTVDFRNIHQPETKPMLIVANPENAFQLSFYPNQGVGLLRLEFIINNTVHIHPMALVKFDSIKDQAVKAEIEKITSQYPDKKEYFIDQLSQSVATVAAAFYPKEVIVRMSDFKTNEYANLLGGKDFEPAEENPMLGFRGASRYYNDRYKQGFQLECEAMKRVRDEMGLTNVKLMIPFCRTVEEAEKVIALMHECGLTRGKNGLQLYMMVEIPSNVILADEFAKLFDGFSIGSNDLTQLTLGIDRDSAIIKDLFNEQNPAVKMLIADVILAARTAKIRIGLCGQAPSDYPAFAAFLVEQNIDSISFNSDALLKGIENMYNAETEKNKSPINIQLKNKSSWKKYSKIR